MAHSTEFDARRKKAAMRKGFLVHRYGRSDCRRNRNQYEVVAIVIYQASRVFGGDSAGLARRLNGSNAT